MEFRNSLEKYLGRYIFLLKKFVVSEHINKTIENLNKNVAI